MIRSVWLILCICAAFCVAGGRPSAAAEPVDFNRDIRPILSKNCFACHGRDEETREADLRLDTREAATAERDGEAAVLPGNSADSGIIARILSDDPDERMPPADTGMKLKDAEIDLLKRWIDQGAPYTRHWSFSKPLRAELPKVNHTNWAKSPLDRFMLARLEQEGLRPSPEADRYTMIRRLSFDLTGLPPTSAEVEAFVNDRSSKAYEKVVDRLLASPHYGERWARVWMDLARYADTQGYEKDAPRTVWPWRDWLIKALNDDLPYDQFTIQQIAGDLLPEATSQQVLATVFHRHTMTNTEGGTDNEEFRVAAVKDRVDTTGQVWLGLSVGCAKCHSHKYDPITQTEYYQLFAIFNQTEDMDANDDRPKQALPSPFNYQKHNNLFERIATERQKLAKSSNDRGTIEKQIAALQTELVENAMTDKPPSVPVMRDHAKDKQRKTHLLVKGDFLNPGAEVSPGVPAEFHPLNQATQPNRLGLAQWLVDRNNPLTARVTVNRIWARLFGIGLVETEEDFGTQGELPSHPKLLDWLALEFQETHHWSQKQLCKTIAMSSTYRQSSRVPDAMLKRDPRNRLLARGPRFRLEAEMIRDQALTVSGLLSRKFYGPPVMPPQPEGIWKTVYNGGDWVTSKGEDRYRRGLYTYAKRTSGYPSYLLFDGGSGEVCMPRRIRTNTATAALVTLNDPVYTEAAQALARRILTEPNGGSKIRSAFAWRLVTGRPGKPFEIDRITALYHEQLAYYRVHSSEASAMAIEPLGALPEGLDPAEAAAWTVVGGVLLNLDETLTKG
jgi:hypothetical protein